jgi:hypothetical protein
MNARQGLCLIIRGVYNESSREAIAAADINALCFERIALVEVVVDALRRRSEGGSESALSLPHSRLLGGTLAGKDCRLTAEESFIAETATLAEFGLVRGDIYFTQADSRHGLLLRIERKNYIDHAYGFDVVESEICLCFQYGSYVCIRQSPGFLLSGPSQIHPLEGPFRHRRVLPSLHVTSS